MAFRRVLVGVNGSPSSVEALDQARRLLDGDGEVRLLAAIDNWNPIGGQQASTEELRARAVDVLARLEREHAPGMRVTTTLREALVRAALVQEAKDWNADLVAVGMHHISALIAPATMRIASVAPTSTGFRSSWRRSTAAHPPGSRSLSSCRRVDAS
jgi:nucleotide-binding universal stress UspA family protein